MIDNACEWGEAAFLIFSDNVGTLIYYTHIFPLVISLFLGFQVFINNPKQRSNRVLFALTLLFSIWVYFDLILWASPTPELVMFFWSAIVPVEIMMYLCALYLVYLFTNNQKDIKVRYKYLIALVLAPVVLFGHTSLNVMGLSPDCDTGAFEGILIQYMYFIEVVIIAIAAFLSIRGYLKEKDLFNKKRILYIGSATVVFLSFFTIGNLTLSFSLGPYYEQYKLFGMPLFAAMVAYTIVIFGAFRTKVLLAEVLISALWILVFSTLLFRDISNARPIIFATLVVFGFLGIILSKTIRKEIEQREEIEMLASKLEKANTRLQQMDKLKSEFVSIASHQLRSPITAISGYASLISEGSYGEVPNKMKEPIDRIVQSARMMATSIEDYLNVSRIEAGNMKYNYEDFNLATEAEHISDDLRPEALHQGLVLLFRKRIESQATVHADLGKVQQIIHNLINNAIKYTPKGAITVYVHDDVLAKRIYIDIIDTGIGMNKDTLHSIFQKFERGDKANTVNVKGTGLGLYVALKMAEAMGGSITPHSDGEGKGSRFTIELPLIV